MDKYGQMSIWNKTMMIASIIIILLFSGLLCMIGIQRTWTSYIIYTLYGLFIFITVIALSKVPLDVSVSDTIFRINTPLRAKIIPLERIKSARQVPDDYQISLRFGSTGYFGWWGLFKSPEDGTVIVFASNLEELMLVEFVSGKKYIVSCSNAKEMSRQVEERIEALPTR